MRWHEIAERGAAQAVALTRSCAPELAVTTEITPQAAAPALIALSAQARILVIGARTVWDNRLVGPTTMEVARHAHWPLVVWRGVEGRPIPRRKPVVVGVDGTEFSTAAMDLGFELAAAFGTTVTAVHCGPHRLQPVGREIGETRSGSAVLAEARGTYRAKHPGVEITEMAVPGVPATVLAEAGHDAQLVAVGTRARDAATAALFGSTSRDLLHHAPCPVLLCR